MKTIKAHALKFYLVIGAIVLFTGCATPVVTPPSVAAVVTAAQPATQSYATNANGTVAITVVPAVPAVTNYVSVPAATNYAPNVAATQIANTIAAVAPVIPAPWGTLLAALGGLVTTASVGIAAYRNSQAQTHSDVATSLAYTINQLKNPAVNQTAVANATADGVAQHVADLLEDVKQYA